MSSLPSELQRPTFLMRRLDNAIRVAKQFNAAKASIPVENAEELVQLLAGLVENGSRHRRPLRVRWNGQACTTHRSRELKPRFNVEQFFLPQPIHGALNVYRDAQLLRSHHTEHRWMIRREGRELSAALPAEP